MRLVRNHISMRNVAALVVVFITTIFWYYSSSNHGTIVMPVSELNKYHSYKEVMTESQLNAFLREFYKSSVLDYGHRNSLPNTKPVKELTEKALNETSVVKQGKYLSLGEYRFLKMERFIKNRNYKLGNNLKNGEKRRVLAPLPSKINRKKLKKPIYVDENLIKKELNNLKIKGRINGDDDLLNLPYLKTYLNSKNQKFIVPNLVHFVWFSCHDFRIIDYMCMLSVLRYQHPDFILVHGDCEPKGQYWTWLKEEAGDKLKFVKKSPPEEIFGKKIIDVEHKSDVARLDILLQVGGIYLDTDTMVLKSLDDLRNRKEIVLGEYNEKWLGNAAILANKESKFLKKWFLEYRKFSTKEKDWLKSSMLAPYQLWNKFSNSIHVVKNMMRPHYDEVDYLLFNGLIDWSDFWMIHLSPRKMKAEDLQRTIPQMAVLNSTYGEVARHALWGDSAVKDVTPWVLHPDFNKKFLA